jgi:hypothetical protein
MSDGTLTKDQFRNRIVGLRWIKASEIKRNPRNFRRHPEFQQNVLEGALRELGITGAVIVRPDGDGYMLLDGELRSNVLDDQEVAALETDLEPHEDALFLSTYDPITAMATVDTETLDGVLRDVQTGEASLQEFLSEQAENAGITPPEMDYEPPESDQKGFRSYVFSLTDKQYEVVDEAITYAKELVSGGDNPHAPSNALAHICSGFLNQHETS